MTLQELLDAERITQEEFDELSAEQQPAGEDTPPANNEPQEDKPPENHFAEYLKGIGYKTKE